MKFNLLTGGELRNQTCHSCEILTFFVIFRLVRIALLLLRVAMVSSNFKIIK